MGVDQPGLRPSIPLVELPRALTFLLSWSLRLHPPAACSSTKQNHPTTRGDLRNRFSFLSGIWTATRNASITREHRGTVSHVSTLVFLRAPFPKKTGNIFINFTFIFAVLVILLVKMNVIKNRRDFVTFKLSSFVNFWWRKIFSSDEGIVKDLWKNSGSNCLHCGEITWLIGLILISLLIFVNVYWIIFRMVLL